MWIVRIVGRAGRGTGRGSRGAVFVFMAEQLAPTTSFEVGSGEGHAAYTWNQNVEEVAVEVDCPTGLSAKRDVRCTIGSGRVKLETASAPSDDKAAARSFITLLDHDLFALVKPDECFWTLDSKRGIVSLTLQKLREGESWAGVFKGHGDISDVDRDAEQKRLLLERFQLEHPGFDFSGAEVNGSCPDASTFLGGFPARG